MCTDCAVGIQLHAGQPGNQVSNLSQDKQLFSFRERPNVLAHPGSCAVGNREYFPEEVNHLRPCSFEVKSGRRFTSTHFYVSLTCLWTTLPLMLLCIYMF